HVAFSVALRLCCFAADQFVEEALFAARRSILVQQRETGVIEFAEELVPRYFFKAFVISIRRVRKYQTDDARVLTAVRRLDGGRFAATRFRPFPDLVMVSRNLGLSRFVLWHSQLHCERPLVA